jgi:hypothetical protein
MCSKTRRCIFAAIAVGVVGIAICSGVAAFNAASNPARQPPKQIRASLLEKTPPGTYYKEVEAFIQSNGWRYRMHEPGEAAFEVVTISAYYADTTAFRGG